MKSLIEELKPTNKKEFRVESGNLIIADPFYLGYPREIDEHISNLTDELTSDYPFKVLDNGVIFYNTYSKGSASDGLYWIFKKNNDFFLHDEEHNLVAEIKDKKIGSATLDVGTLLIGDYETFFLDEKKWDIEGRRESIKKNFREMEYHILEKEIDSMAEQSLKGYLSGARFVSRNALFEASKSCYVPEFDSTNRVITLKPIKSI